MKPTVYRVPYGEPVHYVPAGCLHWPIGEKDMLRRWVKEMQRLPNAFTVLMGDTQDCARTHYRDHVRGYRADQNSQLALDEWVRRDVADLAKELSPIQGQIAGAILGNHLWEFADGTNSEQYLCQLLKIPYLGPTGIVCLEFRDKGGKGRCRLQQVIYAHHHGGSQGGRTTGADANALERSELVFDADIYTLSHTHRRLGFKLPKLGVTSKGSRRLVERTKVFVRSGAFLKGFGEDNPSTSRPHIPSYAESKALRPTDLGWVTVGIHARGGNGGNDAKVDYTVTY